MAGDRETLLEDLVEFYKALADRTRLRLVGLLAERPRYGAELAAALGVSAPTVSHHLFRLRAAGLVTAGRHNNQVHYRLETERLGSLARALVPPEPPARDEREPVVRAFFDGERLKRLPSARRKRLLVLEEVARRFLPDRLYREREVDALLKPITEDHCSVRRALVDHRFLTREKGIYRRLPAPPTS